jgi:hypothetical protein
MESYIITCGQFSTIVELDVSLFENEKEIYMEAASQALEGYFRHRASDPLNDFTTIINTKEEDENEAFVLMTKYILFNIGRHELAGDFGT